MNTLKITFKSKWVLSVRKKGTMPDAVIVEIIENMPGVSLDRRSFTEIVLSVEEGKETQVQEAVCSRFLEVYELTDDQLKEYVEFHLTSSGGERVLDSSSVLKKGAGQISAASGSFGAAGAAAASDTAAAQSTASGTALAGTGDAGRSPAGGTPSQGSGSVSPQGQEAGSAGQQSQGAGSGSAGPQGQGAGSASPQGQEAGSTGQQSQGAGSAGPQGQGAGSISPQDPAAGSGSSQSSSSDAGSVGSGKRPPFPGGPGSGGPAAPKVSPFFGKPAVKRAEPEKNETIDTIMEEIRHLKGADQFIEICEGINRMVPILKERNIASALTNGCYLFSINPGCGCTSALNLLAKLFNITGLMDLKGNPYEAKVSIDSKSQDNINAMMGKVASMSNKMVCIDISDWADQSGSPEFRELLMRIHNRRESNIFVFRVPYLEQDALHRITENISDVLTVREACFVPLTPQQLQDIAEEKLREFGYTATDEAMVVFRHRISEEKSDGKFYGMKTIYKVVDEMLLSKVQSVLEGGEDNTVINEPDLKNLRLKEHESTISARKLLDEMIGIEGIRRQLDEIMAQIEYAHNNQGVEAPAMHMRFEGNPGTGKTTVARCIGQLFKEKGILSNGYFLECSGNDFIGQYVGHTAPKTLAICRDAYGSVLFIDEAYALADANYRDGGFAREAVDTLIAQMENHRNDMVVIMAGYTKDMDRLMQLNSGLSGRMPYVLKFPNYTREQLADIYMYMAGKSTFTLSEGMEQQIRDFFHNLSDDVLNDPHFSNARYVRNLFEKTWSKTIMRAQLDGSDPNVIMPIDFSSACSETKSQMEKKVRRAIGFSSASRSEENGENE